MLDQDEIERLLPFASPKTCAKLAKMIVDAKLKDPKRE